MFGIVGRPGFSTRRYSASCYVQDVFPVNCLLRYVSVCCLGVLRARSQDCIGHVFRRFLHFVCYVESYGIAAFGWYPEGVWDVFAFLYEWAFVSTARDRSILLTRGQATCGFRFVLRLSSRFAGGHWLLRVFLSRVDFV